MSLLNMNDFVAARATLARRHAAIQAERFGRVIQFPEHDEPSMLVDEAAEPNAPPMNFHLVYRDGKGDLSARCITLVRLQRQIEDEIKVTSFCHVRHALRTFLASRMLEVLDLATGESDDDGLTYFGRHPMLQALSADTYSTMSDELIALQECRDDIIILSVVAASDGRIEEAEEDQIVRHVMDENCDLDLTESELRHRIRSFVPDEIAFDRALARVCKREKDPGPLLRSLRRLVEADGSIDRQEVLFAEEVSATLRAAGRLA